MRTLKFLKCSNSSKSVGILNAWIGKGREANPEDFREGFGGNFTGFIHRHLFSNTCCFCSSVMLDQLLRNGATVPISEMSLRMKFACVVLHRAAVEKWVLLLIREGRREELATDHSGQSSKKFQKIPKDSKTS